MDNNSRVSVYRSRFENTCPCCSILLDFGRIHWTIKEAIGWRGVRSGGFVDAADSAKLLRDAYSVVAGLDSATQGSGGE